MRRVPWRCIQEVVEFLSQLVHVYSLSALATYESFSQPAPNLGYVIVCKLPPSCADLAFQLIPSALKNLRIRQSPSATIFGCRVSGEHTFCQFTLECDGSD